MASVTVTRQVSSSAPPSFRARKNTNPLEEDRRRDPMPQNAGRMTGPPMQKGPGAGSMFADGKRGQQQGAMPRSPNMGAPGPGPTRVMGQMQGKQPMTPNYPQGRMGPAMPKGQMQGAHPRGVPTATKMMADGDPSDPDSQFVDTPPMGGMPDDDSSNQGPMPGDGSAAQAAPGGGADGSGGPMPMIRPEAVNYHDEPHACQLCMYMGQNSNCSVLQMQVSPDGGCTAFEAGQGGGGEPDQDDMNGGSQNDAGTSGAPSLS